MAYIRSVRERVEYSNASVNGMSTAGKTLGAQPMPFDEYSVCVCANAGGIVFNKLTISFKLMAVRRKKIRCSFFRALVFVEHFSSTPTLCRHCSCHLTLTPNIDRNHIDSRQRLNCVIVVFSLLSPLQRHVRVIRFERSLTKSQE